MPIKVAIRATRQEGEGRGGRRGKGTLGKTTGDVKRGQTDWVRSGGMRSVRYGCAIEGMFCTTKGDKISILTKPGLRLYLGQS